MKSKNNIFFYAIYIYMTGELEKLQDGKKKLYIVIWDIISI